MVHGYLYLVYVIVAVDLWFRTRLPAGRMVLVVLAGTVPFMSFVAERWVTGRVRPMIEARERVPAADPAASAG
jgi:HAMP domain-containing protein